MTTQISMHAMQLLHHLIGTIVVLTLSVVVTSRNCSGTGNVHQNQQRRKHMAWHVNSSVHGCVVIRQHHMRLMERCWFHVGVSTTHITTRNHHIVNHFHQYTRMKNICNDFMNVISRLLCETAHKLCL